MNLIDEAIELINTHTTGSLVERYNRALELWQRGNAVSPLWNSVKQSAVSQIRGLLNQLSDSLVRQIDAAYPDEMSRRQFFVTLLDGLTQPHN